MPRRKRAAAGEKAEARKRLSRGSSPPPRATESPAGTDPSAPRDRERAREARDQARAEQARLRAEQARAALDLTRERAQREQEQKEQRGPTPLQPLLRTTPRNPKHVPSWIERVRRESRMLSLVAHGHTGDEMHAIMHEEFGMTRKACSKLCARMRLQIVDHERDNIPVMKAKAKRRIREHIMRASEANAWSAVIAAEKVLAQMEGTFEPERVEVNVDVRVRDALSKVLSEMDPSQIEHLVHADGFEIIDEAPHALPEHAIEGAVGAVPSLTDLALIVDLQAKHE